MKQKQNFEIVNAIVFKSTLHNVLYWIILKIFGGRG